eukprot:14768735-Alexandrium_andersonii.AAC.1
MSAFPLETLRLAEVHRAAGDLSYQCSFDLGLSEPGQLALPPVLHALVVGHSSGGDFLSDLQYLDVPDAAVQEATRAMVSSGLLLAPHGANAKYQLTQTGLEHIQVSIPLGPPSLACALRQDTPLADCTMWELVMLLRVHSWTHQFHSARPPLPLPYDPAGDPANRIWYTRASDKSLRQGYLVALLSGRSVVHHFGVASYYHA